MRKYINYFLIILLDPQKDILQKLISPGKGILNAVELENNDLENLSQFFQLDNIDDYISGIVLNTKSKREYVEKIGKKVLLGMEVIVFIIFFKK